MSTPVVTFTWGLRLHFMGTVAQSEHSTVLLQNGEMLYLIGLGLGDVKDITVKGLEIVRSCEEVYLEAYTSILSYGLGKKELVLEHNFHFTLLRAEYFRKSSTEGKFS